MVHNSENFGQLQETSWVVTDGAVGNEAQGLALARAVGLPVAVYRAKASGIIGALPVRLQLLLPPSRLIGSIASEPAMTPPWPRLVISVGRHSVPIALAVKQLSGGRTLAVHIQDPKLAVGRFDLVAAPMHDRLQGENVFKTCGSLHSVTRHRIDQAATEFASRIDPLPHPRIAVMLGGKSRGFDLPIDVARDLGGKLAALARATGGSLLVTPSRRTPPASFAALKQEIAGIPAFVFDGQGPNPYLAMLGAADAVVVTGDSVNMVTEAAGTGKPVFIQKLPGRSKRLARFHADLEANGIARPFQGRLDSWHYAPVNDTVKVAEIVRRKLGLA